MMASAANRRIRRLSYAKYGYMFILPFFLVYFIFSLYPLLYTFYISTFRAAGTAVDAEMYYVGFENFKDLLFIDSPVRTQFFQAIGNTLILWICNFIPQIALSLLLAVWFTDNRLHVPGKGFFKVVMYMPNIITAASVATLFLSLFGVTLLTRSLSHGAGFRSLLHSFRHIRLNADLFLSSSLGCGLVTPW